jgi:tRNA(Ile2) C34 agmatinyltransferase TiaS
MSEETKPVCPKCGSNLIQSITNASRCGQCGHQFDLDRNPISTQAHASKNSGWIGWKREPQK